MKMEYNIEIQNLVEVGVFAVSEKQEIVIGFFIIIIEDDNLLHHKHRD